MYFPFFRELKYTVLLPILWNSPFMNASSFSRSHLIRQGNEAFNTGDFRKARELFIQAGYKGGLIRLGDYYMYEKSMPLLAYGYYKRANAKLKIEDLHHRMIAVIANWIGHDKLRPEYRASLQKTRSSTSTPAPDRAYKTDEKGMIEVPVDESLREEARLILSKQNAKWS